MKRKVLFLIDSLAGGGAEKVLSVIVKYFDYDKYEITVCPIVDEGIYCDDVKNQVTDYKPIISYNASFLSRLWNRIKYKLIYSYLPIDWVYMMFIPKGHDVEVAFCEGFVTKLLAHSNSRSKKLAWVHTDLKDNPWPIELGIYKDIEEEYRTYSVYDNIICVSPYAQHSFCELYDLKDKLTTIYNPIDVADIRCKVGLRKKKYDGIFRLISVGRLVIQKGYDRLLKVIKHLHDEGYPVYLTILGEGAERKTLEYYVEEHDMQSYVSLPGFYENPYQKMSESDLFICSSRAEGFSLVIAEAMVLGIPIVSTNCSGPNELLQGGKYGLLVENSKEGMYKGIKALLDNHSKLNDLGNLSLLGGNMFGVDNTMNSIEKLLN